MSNDARRNDISVNLAAPSQQEEKPSSKAEFAFGYVGSDGQTHSVTAYCSKTSLVLKSRGGLYKNYKFNIIQC